MVFTGLHCTMVVVLNVSECFSMYVTWSECKIVVQELCECHCNDGHVWKLVDIWICLRTLCLTVDGHTDPSGVRKDVASHSGPEHHVVVGKRYNI